MSYDLWINKNNIITKYIEIFKREMGLFVNYNYEYIIKII